jgi:uncharacterized protein YbjT (DUF2867 family)
MPPTAVVTGAFSYIGHAAASSLMRRGWQVRTLTNRATPLNSLDAVVERAPLQFEDIDALVSFMRGARVFVNTYWIRYPLRGLTFDEAVVNSAVLLAAARTAGVRRIVHVSVSRPSAEPPLDYYAGKARVEAIVGGLGVPHTIVRPTLVIGPGDILVNNIAWLLRRLPVFAMPGSGGYRLQPVWIGDVGEILADAAESDGSFTIDAAGPDVITFDALVRTVAQAIDRPRPIVHVRPWLALFALRLIGLGVRDVVLSRQELEGLMAERLVSAEPPRGTTAVDARLAALGAQLGRRYASEARRHFKRGS